MTDRSDLEDFTAYESKRVEEAYGWALLCSGGAMSGVGIVLDAMAVASTSIMVLASLQVLFVGGLILSRTVESRARRRAVAADRFSRQMSPQPRSERAAAVA